MSFEIFEEVEKTDGVQESQNWLEELKQADRQGCHYRRQIDQFIDPAFDLTDELEQLRNTFCML